MLSSETKDVFKELTLLVADDEEVALEQMHKTLAKKFSHVYIANDGVEALELYEKQNPNIDIIVSDISMPNKNGLELAREVKEINRETPIIIVTAYSELEYLHEAIDIGVDQFIQKPIDPRKLFEALIKCSNTVMSTKNREHIAAYKLKEAIYHSKKELLKDIAHHWRNPLHSLNMVLLNVEDVLMDEKIQNNDELQTELFSYCEMAKKQIDKMSTVINNFIGFGDNRKKECDILIKEAIVEAWNLVDNSFPHIECKLEINMDDNFRLSIDREAINFTLYHILRNSFEEFERKKIESPTFKIYMEHLEDSDKIYLEDNGGGLLEKNGEFSFMPYSSDKGIESGKGVSLFLVKKILLDYDAHVDYKNTPGKGFTIVIEIKKQKEPCS
eukprot:TRINITY_DN19444_c0_g1_i1.p2 TRINITY_DN19444_c0_g1~~TRINITY_DN19444_c0_g1_i1.p2  ORF type:complete len:386 (-),score=43.75 TRINITY_DN19444_c0_g1_i1:17-1174(-)